MHVALHFGRERQRRASGGKSSSQPRNEAREHGWWCRPQAELCDCLFDSSFVLLWIMKCPESFVFVCFLNRFQIQRKAVENNVFFYLKSGDSPYRMEKVYERSLWLSRLYSPLTWTLVPTCSFCLWFAIMIIKLFLHWVDICRMVILACVPGLVSLIPTEGARYKAPLRIHVLNILISSS